MANFLFVYRNGKDSYGTMTPEEMQQMLQNWNTWISEGLRKGWMVEAGDGLKTAVKELAALRKRFSNLKLDYHSRTFNTELVAALELSFMLDVAESIVQSALSREESRGAHQRTDFPARDDRRFLAHSLASRQADGSCRVDYVPVTITRWPPGERVYGR